MKEKVYDGQVKTYATKVSRLYVRINGIQISESIQKTIIS